MCASNFFFLRKSFFYFFYKVVFPVLTVFLKMRCVFKEFLLNQYLFIFYNARFIDSTFFLSSASGFNSSLFLSKKMPPLFYKSLDFLLLQCFLFWLLKVKDHLKDKIFFLGFYLGTRSLTYPQFRNLILIFANQFFYITFYLKVSILKLRINTSVFVFFKLLHFLFKRFGKLTT